MGRMVRDKELAALGRARAEARAEVDAALQRARDAEEAVEAGQQRCGRAGGL
jgi:hypothetical protein